DRRVSVERLLGRQLPLATEGIFQGDSSTLEFISPYSLANGPGDPMDVKYSFESGNLVYNETPLAEYTAGYSDAAVKQSLGAFTDVRFSYLGRDSLGNRSWLNEWKDRTPPSVVRVEINKDVMILPMAKRQSIVAAWFSSRCCGLCSSLHSSHFLLRLQLASNSQRRRIRLIRTVL